MIKHATPTTYNKHNYHTALFKMQQIWKEMDPKLKTANMLFPPWLNEMMKNAQFNLWLPEKVDWTTSNNYVIDESKVSWFTTKIIKHELSETIHDKLHNALDPVKKIIASSSENNKFANTSYKFGDLPKYEPFNPLEGGFDQMIPTFNSDDIGTNNTSFRN